MKISISPVRIFAIATAVALSQNASAGGIGGGGPPSLEEGALLLEINETLFFAQPDVEKLQDALGLSLSRPMRMLNPGMLPIDPRDLRPNINGGDKPRQD